MHVGGVRTALFAWLIARQQHGQFILRLEDTDQKREVAGSAEHILVSLNALGVTHDEGPDIGPDKTIVTKTTISRILITLSPFKSAESE